MPPTGLHPDPLAKSGLPDGCPATNPASTQRTLSFPTCHTPFVGSTISLSRVERQGRTSQRGRALLPCTSPWATRAVAPRPVSLTATPPETRAPSGRRTPPPSRSSSAVSAAAGPDAETRSRRGATRPFPAETAARLSPVLAGRPPQGQPSLLASLPTDHAAMPCWPRGTRRVGAPHPKAARGVQGAGREHASRQGGSAGRPARRTDRSDPGTRAAPDKRRSPARPAAAASRMDRRWPSLR